MSYQSFAEQMALLESSGRYYAKRGGFLGKYQFGKMRLIDLKILGDDYSWLNGMTEKRFLRNDENVQERAFFRHVLDYCKRLDRDKYRDLREGYNLSGLLAVAHLIGFSGMVSWARASECQQRNDPKFKDGLATPAHEYYDALKGHYLYDLMNFKKLAKGG